MKWLSRLHVQQPAASECNGNLRVCQSRGVSNMEFTETKASWYIVSMGNENKASSAAILKK